MPERLFRRAKHVHRRLLSPIRHGGAIAAFSLVFSVAGCTVRGDEDEGCQGDCEAARAVCIESCDDDEACEDRCDESEELCLDECELL